MVPMCTSDKSKLENKFGQRKQALFNFLSSVEFLAHISGSWEGSGGLLSLSPLKQKGCVCACLGGMEVRRFGQHILWFKFS